MWPEPKSEQMKSLKTKTYLEMGCNAEEGSHDGLGREKQGEKVSTLARCLYTG